MKRELGVCYYPEHWPEAQWREDAARMKEAGLSWVRIGEFAWSRLEPAPGRLEFDWLDRAVEVLGQAGLKLVMGTPTATPPRWMATRHPDMFARDAKGDLRGFGSRRHYCFSHRGYREECQRIAGLLGARFGQNPHVAAWQIDNEYGCHATVLSYSEAARSASACARLKATTSSEAKRRKSITWAGFGSVTVRLGSSISSKLA